MKSKFMTGMNLQEQKKCGILLIAIGLVMFAVGFLLSDAHVGDFYNGLGCGIFACGAVRLLRVYLRRKAYALRRPHSVYTPQPPECRHRASAVGGRAAEKATVAVCR